MEVKELQERIKVLNKALSDLLLQFENETNLPITDLSFVRRENSIRTVDGVIHASKVEYVVEAKSEIRA